MGWVATKILRLLKSIIRVFSKLLMSTENIIACGSSFSFKIEECQKEILEARGMIEAAERSLAQSEGGNAIRDGEDGGLDRDEERLESVKAASISAIVGTLAGLPIFLNQVTSTSQLLVPTVITFISCALFGVTFRYTIRRDLDNIQLKTGTSAAFGFVKGTENSSLNK